MAEKYQKKKLNREDHKEMDDAAKNVKRGASLLMLVATIGVGVKKNGPKIISVAKNIITKA